MKAFSFKIGGRIFVDGGVNSQPIQPFPPPGTTFPVVLRPFFPAHGASGFSNQVGFRQARLEVEGRAWTEWFYKLQYDFTEPPTVLSKEGFAISGSRGSHNICSRLRLSLFRLAISSRRVAWKEWPRPNIETSSSAGWRVTC